MKLKSYILILIAATFSSGCSLKEDMSNIDSGPPDLVIISTNDIHSNIEMMPKLASLTKKWRENYPNVLLIDAGDRQNGYAAVDYSNEPGMAVIDMMNMLGYDVATLGDHDFDYGQKLLAEKIKRAKFDIVCANITGSEILSEFEPYTSIQINGKKIVILGLINVDKSTNCTPTLESNIESISFEDPAKTAKLYKPLKARSDMMIIVSHCGTSSDSIIATQTPQVNLIIGGGIGEPIFNQKEVNGVTITHAGNSLQYASLTKIWFGVNGNNRCENSLIDLSKCESDEDFTIILDKVKSQTDFSEVIGINSADMDKTAIAGLFCRAMMQSCFANYALYDYYSINRESQAKGLFTLENLYNLESYKYQFYSVEISIRALDNIIRENYSKGAKDGKKTIHIEGMNYEIKTDANGNITNTIYYNKANIISDLSMKIKIAINERIYTTYRKHIEQNSTSKGTVTESVIKYLLLSGKNI